MRTPLLSHFRLSSRQLFFGAPLVLGLLSLSACTRPTVGFCNIDEECNFGQYCAQPAHECTDGTVIRGLFSGGQTVPPTASDASGSFRMIVNPDGLSGSYTLNHSVQNPGTIKLFRGRIGSAGVATNKPPLMNTSGTLDLDPDLVSDLKVGTYYLQISSTEFPNGEVRAQLYSSNPADTHEVVGLSGVLSGLQEHIPLEVPGTGSVQMTLDEDKQSISYNYSINALDSTPLGLHIHHAGFGLDGPIICDLPMMVGPSVMGTLSAETILGCVTDPQRNLPQKHIWRIALKSGLGYLNLHTNRNAGGELRAQLLPTKALPFGVLLKTTPIDANSQPKGQVSFYLSADQSVLAYKLSTAGVQNITSAVFVRGSVAGRVELDCPSLSLSGGKDKAQGTCPLVQSPTGTQIGQADLTNGELYIVIKTTAVPTGELEGHLVLPKG